MNSEYKNIDNRLVALQAIRQVERITRRDLADLMQISPSLATKITADLIERGLVYEKGKLGGNNVGRPMDCLALVPEGAYAVGLHMNHSRYIAVVTNIYGEVMASLVDPILATDDRETIIRGIIGMISRVVEASHVPEKAIAGVGVGLSDIVDPITQTSYGWPDLPGWSSAWANFPVGEALASFLPYQHIFVDDIVRSLGLAEARYGAGTKDNFVYILIDEGIGMAIMLNGKSYIGSSHIAGEIAHVPVSASTELCSCGNLGCLQIFSGISAVLKHMHNLLEESPIRSTLRSIDHELSIEDVFMAAENGDKSAIQVLSTSGEALGKALAVVVNLIGPRAIVLGGTFSRSPFYIDAAERSMKMSALTMAVHDVRIERSNQDMYAGARGAATQVLDALFTSDKNNILDYGRALLIRA